MDANAAGSLLAVGLPGPELDSASEARLRDLAPSCVILFRRNVIDPVQLRELTSALHALPSQPLLAVDQEGGRVARLREPFTRVPAAASIGATNDPDLAYRVGLLLARELRSVGLDLDFAPVLDVVDNPQNTVIGDRAFGSTPERVVALALALHRGLRDGGILSCGKHFPGHGNTVEDSHFHLPVVQRSRQDWERIELPPFRAAVAAGVPMLLTAHVIHRALDPDRPATLSPRVVRGLLRDELGYRGVIATDDMDMKAIADHHPAGEAAILAVAAGCDMVMSCQNLDSALIARDALADAIRVGRIDPQPAVERIATLRSQRPPSTPAECPLPNAQHVSLVTEIEALATSASA